MGHPNLSDGLNRLIDATDIPGATLELREVKVGQIIKVVFGDEGKKTSLTIRIDKPAGKGWGEDSALGTILAVELQPDKVESFRKVDLPIPPIGEKCALFCACTRNPGAPFGMTMLHVHHLTKGRHFSWTTRPNTNNEIGWLFPETVSGWSVHG
ncbi:MAG: hypothetical protein WAX85_02365 [Minisyncoccia bacterium]